MENENNILESLYKSIQTFDTLTIEAEHRDKLWKYNDALMQSLRSIIEDGECDKDAKMRFFDTTMAQYVEAMKELFPKLIVPRAPHPLDEEVKAVSYPVGKSDPNRYDEIEEVEKFNPYHDARGRFATANGFASFTVRTKDPSKQHMADAAIAREKERAAASKPKVTFTPAKTKKEAVAYAQNELGFTSASYGTKLDIDTINHINEQITQIQAQFPEAKGACQVLKTTTSNCYAQIRTRGDGTMNFEIGTNLYGNGMDYINKSYERDVGLGFHPAGTEGKSIIWHEYGHVLATVSTKEKYGASASGKISANGSDQSKFITSRRGQTVEKEWLFEAANTTGKKPSEMMKNVSRYAQKNPAETFAEAFAEVMTSKAPRDDALAIVKASGWYRN